MGGKYLDFANTKLVQWRAISPAPKLLTIRYAKAHTLSVYQGFIQWGAGPKLPPKNLTSIKFKHQNVISNQIKSLAFIFGQKLPKTIWRNWIRPLIHHTSTQNFLLLDEALAMA